MNQNSTPSLMPMAEKFLEQWDTFIQAENALHALPEPDSNSPLLDTIANTEALLTDNVFIAMDQGILREFSQTYQQMAEHRDWTLPTLIRLNLYVAQKILEHPLVDDQTAVSWELCVIPATGRQEDLHRFASPEASKALNEHGLAPPNGQAVLLGVTTPDELMAWMSDHHNVVSWREQCAASDEKLPVAGNLPLMTLSPGCDNEAHFGAFVYVVGMVERFNPDNIRHGSPIENIDFETVEERWNALTTQWGDRLPSSLSITEPDMVWDGCAYVIGVSLLQTLYIQHAVGGAPMTGEQSPTFAVVMDEEKNTFRVAGIFPDGEILSISLSEEMVAFLPALLDSPDFDFLVVEESDFLTLAGEILGEKFSPTAPKRRFS